MNICEILVEAQPRFDCRPFLIFGDSNHTLPSFLRGIHSGTDLLRRQGLRPGDRVLLLGRNRPEWLVAFFAILSLGATVIPVNFALAESEVDHIIADSSPSLAIVDDELKETLAGQKGAIAVISSVNFAVPEAEDAGASLLEIEFVQCGEDDPALIVYTSGTTGKSKGVMIGHRSILYTAKRLGDHYAVTERDTTIVLGPLSFLYPFELNFLTCIAKGAGVVLPERFHPKGVIDAVERHGVTIIMGVPTMYVMMCNLETAGRHQLASVRLCISAGAILTPSLVSKFADSFGVQIFDLWGLTEASPLTSYDVRVDCAVRPESCGRAIPGVALKIVDAAGAELPPGEIGEIWAKTPSAMLGYYKNPKATAEVMEDGWVKSGDLGRMSQDGHFYIVGRKKDLIIRGGANIYPAEIEDVIFRMSEIAECAVIGEPDEVYGEIVHAFVVQKDKATVSSEDVVTFCRAHLADYKIPAKVTFANELPKGPTGKILKRVLRNGLP